MALPTGSNGPVALPAGPGGPRPLGPGPAADLPRRPLGRPEQPAAQGPGASPLPRRTPAPAGGTDNGNAAGADGMPVNGLPGNGSGLPTGRQVFPPAPVPGANGNGHGPQEPRPAPQRPEFRPEPRPEPMTQQAPPPAAPPVQAPRPIPPLVAQSDRQSPFAARPPAQFGQPPAGAGAPGPEESTPIFEQLQSEWFRQRPASRPAPPAAPAPAAQAAQAAPAAPAAERPRPAAPPPVQAPAPTPAPARPPAPVRAQAPAPARAPVAQPAPAPAAADDDAWASPADEGWRAAERLLQPTSGGTTRAGLPMRVPQAHLMPGGAGSDGPTVAPPEPVRPAYRSPEAVRSRLASYHQGVRRGRHADRAADGADTGDNRGDPSELVQQSQEQS
jgi:hypothetical protein